MAFTVADVITEVRPLVADSAVPYRWEDTVIIPKVDEGLQDVFSRRPDRLLTLSPDAPTSVVAVTDVLPLNLNNKTALIYFAAARLLAERSSDKSLRAQGQEFYKIYLNLMES